MKRVLFILFPVVLLTVWLMLPSHESKQRSNPDRVAHNLWDREQLDAVCHRSDLLLVASTGGSGSTMLCQALRKAADSSPNKTWRVAKTHLLPPDPGFAGKVVYIYSDPYRSAESFLHRMLELPRFAEGHFSHMEGSHPEELAGLEDLHQQTEELNVLALDSYAVTEQLRRWLKTGTKPSNPETANVLIVRYEQLWDEETISAIKDFTGISFELPARRPRAQYERSELEQRIRTRWNHGSDQEPIYEAYKQAWQMWAESPSVEYRRV